MERGWKELICAVAGKSEIPEPPPGLVLIGGDTRDGPLTSVEPLGFPSGCMIPNLPEKRYGAGSFVAPQLDGQLTVCGGWWDGKPNSTDCLTLNKEEGRWERGHLKGTPDGVGGVKGVISIDEVGVYLVHTASMSFLAQDATDWNIKETPLADIQCATKINERGMLVVGGRKLTSVREFTSKEKKASQRQSNSSQNETAKESEWQDPTRWPRLYQGRRGPGCGATNEVFIVAGGITGWDVILDTVEIFQLKSRALGAGGIMIQARAFFSLVPVGETFIRLLAVGGEGVNGVTLNTTEWWNQDDNDWEEGPELDTPRSSPAASFVPVKLVCGSLTNGSFCETMQGNACTECAVTEEGDDFVCSIGDSVDEMCDKQKCPLRLHEKAPNLAAQNTGVCKNLYVLSFK